MGSRYIYIYNLTDVLLWPILKAFVRPPPPPPDHVQWAPGSAARQGLGKPTMAIENGPGLKIYFPCVSLLYGGCLKW